MDNKKERLWNFCVDWLAKNGVEHLDDMEYFAQSDTIHLQSPLFVCELTHLIFGEYRPESICREANL